MKRLAVAAGLAALALLGSACGSNDTGDERPAQPSGAEPATGSGSAPAHGGLAECLRANGVPDTAGPGAVLGPPPEVDPATWDTAMKACSTLAPGPAAP